MTTNSLKRQREKEEKTERQRDRERKRKRQRDREREKEEKTERKYSRMLFIVKKKSVTAFWIKNVNVFNQIHF